MKIQTMNFIFQKKSKSIKNMFHIIVNTPAGEEKRGKASNLNELLKLLKPKEIKSIFEHDAFEEMKEVFKTAKMNIWEDSFLSDINGITVNFISNGFEITTLVFYF